MKKFQGNSSSLQLDQENNRPEKFSFTATNN